MLNPHATDSQGSTPPSVRAFLHAESAPVEQQGFYWVGIEEAGEHHSMLDIYSILYICTSSPTTWCCAQRLCFETCNPESLSSWSKKKVCTASSTEEISKQISRQISGFDKEGGVVLVSTPKCEGGSRHLTNHFLILGIPDIEFSYSM